MTQPDSVYKLHTAERMFFSKSLNNSDCGAHRMGVVVTIGGGRTGSGIGGGCGGCDGSDIGGGCGGCDGSDIGGGCGGRTGCDIGHASGGGMRPETGLRRRRCFPEESRGGLVTDLLAGETSPLLWSISAGREASAPSFRFFFFTVFREAPLASSSTTLVAGLTRLTRHA